MSKEVEPDWEDYGTLPLSSIFAEDIRDGRVWRVNEFLKTVKAEGEEHVAKEDFKLAIKLLWLLYEYPSVFRNTKNQDEFHKIYEALYDFKDIGKHSTPKERITDSGLISANYLLRTALWNIGGRTEPTIKFFSDMKDNLRPADIEAIARIVKNGLPEDDKTLNALLLREDISKVVRTRIKKVIKTHLDRYKKKKSLIMKAILEKGK